MMRQHDVLGGDAGRQLAVDGHGHRLRPAQRQGLGGEHVLDLAGADAERERPERAVRAGVRVAADDGDAGLGEPELRTDDVDDALARVVHRVQADAELGAVLPQRLHLGAAHRIGDRQQRVGGRDVVVLGGQRQVRPPHAAAVQPQPVEGLRRGDLVDEVEVDVEQVRVRPGPVRCPAVGTTWASQTFSASVRPIATSFRPSASLTCISQSGMAVSVHGQR